MAHSLGVAISQKIREPPPKIQFSYAVHEGLVVCMLTCCNSTWKSSGVSVNDAQKSTIDTLKSVIDNSNEHSLRTALGLPQKNRLAIVNTIRDQLKLRKKGMAGRAIGRVYHNLDMIEALLLQSGVTDDQVLAKELEFDCDETRNGDQLRQILLILCTVGDEQVNKLVQDVNILLR